MSLKLNLSDLGPRYNRKEVQALLGISQELLLSDPVRFGGVWLGPRKLVFFEKLIVQAIRELHASQKDQPKENNMDRAGNSAQREKDRKRVLPEKRRTEMGVHPEIRAFARQNRANLWPVAEGKD